jgi:hypothetical protein
MKSISCILIIDSAPFFVIEKSSDRSLAGNQFPRLLFYYRPNLIYKFTVVMIGFTEVTI